MLYDLWQNKRTGIYFVYDYTPKSQLMRGRPADDFDGTTLNFKLYNAGSDHFRQLIEALKEIFDAQTAIGIPPATAEENNIQKICDRDIYFKAVNERKKRHKADVQITADSEKARVRVKAGKKEIKRAILCDDIASTGLTMQVYSRLALEAGAGEVIPFALAHKTGDKDYRCGIFLKEIVQYQDEPFKNRMEVFRYLRDQGYKIGKSKLFGDTDRGLLKLQRDKSVLKQDVEAYVNRAGIRKDPGKTVELEGFHLKKLEEEIKGLQLKNEKLQLEVKKGRSELMPVAEAETEIADNLNAMLHAFRHLIETGHEQWLLQARQSPVKLKNIITTDLLAMLDELAGRGEIRIRYNHAAA